MQRFLLVTLALLSILLVGLSSHEASSAPSPSRPRYTLVVDLDYERAHLEAVETVLLTNPASVPLTSTLFYAPAAAYGGFVLSRTLVAGYPVSATLTDIALDIPLPMPLMPGQAVSITMHFALDLPPSTGRYGAADGVLALGDWYPALAVYDEGWERHVHSDVGDPYFTVASDFDLAVTTRPTVTIAGPGRLLSHQEGTWLFHLEGARDMAFAASERYQVITGTAAGVPITVYYLPEAAAAASGTLAVALDAMAFYSGRIGAYVYPSLTIAQLPLAGLHNAQEHSALFFLRSDIMGGGATPGIFTAHELAHQWFFAVVGNDQIRAPWLDEALVTFLSLEFIRERFPPDYEALWKLWGDNELPGPVNATIYDFPNGGYFDRVYRKGATMLREVYRQIGAEAFWHAMRDYYDTHRYGIAYPQDLLRAFRTASPQAALLSIYRRYLDYGFLAYERLDIAAEVPSTLQQGGLVTIPVTITADSPRVQVTALLDNTPLPWDGGSVVVDTDRLALGGHTLTLTARDDGINQTSTHQAFRVIPRPTPSPERPLATPTTVTPTPIPSPLPSVPPLGSLAAVIGILVMLVIALGVRAWHR